jgi:hypothetical protein
MSSPPQWRQVLAIARRCLARGSERSSRWPPVANDGPRKFSAGRDENRGRAGGRRGRGRRRWAEGAGQPRGADRILANLVTNALRYGEAPVRVRAEQAGRHLRMTDEDEGAACFPAHFRPRLFERFSPCASPSSDRTARGLSAWRSPSRRSRAGAASCTSSGRATERASTSSSRRRAPSGPTRPSRPESRVDHASMGGVNRRRRGQGRRARKVAVLCVGLAAGAGPALGVRCGSKTSTCSRAFTWQASTSAA